MRELMTLVTLLLATATVSPLAEAETSGRDTPPIIDMHLHAFQLPDGGARPVNPVTGRPSISLTTAELRDASLAALARYNIVKAVMSFFAAKEPGIFGVMAPLSVGIPVVQA